MYANEINRMFIELRSLTEEVKTYYKYHALLVIIETILIIVANVTTLAFVYLSGLNTTVAQNVYLMGHGFMRLLYLFLIVREAHNTILEVRLILN